MKFKKKPVIIEATQWFKNGDHPDDGDKGEGKIVRYYDDPETSGHRDCGICGRFMQEHGLIFTLEGSHIVCPRDWIITGIQGEHYPCKPDIFEATYTETTELLEYANKLLGY